jgi:General secretion pathway, M protein.
MREELQNWWTGLSQRERWLVGVAGALAAGVLLWALGRPAYAAFADLENNTALRLSARAGFLPRSRCSRSDPRNRWQPRWRLLRSINFSRNRRARSG